MKIRREIKIDASLANVISSIENYGGSDEDDQLLELAGVDAESFARFLEEIGKSFDPIAEGILRRAREKQGGSEIQESHQLRQMMHGHEA